MALANTRNCGVAADRRRDANVDSGSTPAAPRACARTQAIPHPVSPDGSHANCSG